MTPETLRYAAIMLAAGIGIPTLAALNGRLGALIGSPPAATVVLFSVALVGALTVMFITGETSKLALVPTQPRFLLLGGLLVCFYVLSVTWVAPRFGLGNAITFVLLGQLISASIIDHFGLVGAIVRHMTWTRATGLTLMALGVVMTQRG